MRNLIIAAFITITTITSAFADEVQIPRSAPGDRGQYFLLEAVWKGTTVSTLHKRIGVDTVGFTRLEIDCAKRLVRDTGYGEGSLDAIKPITSDWYELFPGSSKSDLVNFVCSRR